MKNIKVFLLTLTVLSGMLFNANAGHVLLKTPKGCQILGMSPNGRYVTGSETSQTSANRGFLWDLKINEIVWLSAGEESSGHDVSDNGVVSGLYMNPNATANGVPILSGGYWKDGQWYHLENYDNQPITDPLYRTNPMGISADGQYIAGGVYNDFKAVPCVWKNGKIDRHCNLPHPNPNDEGMAFDVTDDGSKVCGWAYDLGTNSVNGDPDRMPCLWNPDYKKLSETAWFSHSADKFSPNGKYVSCTSDRLFIYDIEKDEKIELPLVNPDSKSYATMWVGDDKTVMGTEDGNAFIYKEGIGSMFLQEYLSTYEDVVISPSELNSIFMGVGMTTDGKTIAGTGIDANGYVGFVLLLDKDIDCLEPLGLKLKQLSGTILAQISWDKPLVNASSVRGYNLFRDGEKLNGELLNGNSFLDRNTKIGDTYSYEVQAVYNDCESGLSVANSLTIIDPASVCAAPVSLIGRASGYNDAMLQWIRPVDGDAIMKWNKNKANIGFGITVNGSFYYGIRFDKEMLECYPSDMKVSAISVVPMAEPADLEIVLRIGERPIYSKQIGTNALVIGESNSINVDADVTVGYLLENMTDDLPLFIQVKVTQAGFVYVAGLDASVLNSGYGNLISKDGETWELLDVATEGEYSGSWDLSLVLSKSENSKRLVGYNVYRGDETFKVTSNLDKAVYEFMDTNLSDNTYRYAVDAIYKTSAGEYTSKKSDLIVVKLTDNDEPCMPPSDVKALKYGTDELNDVEISWSSPSAVEEYELSYTNWKKGTTISMAGSERFFAAIKFDKRYLSLYDGFYVDELMFYSAGKVDKYVLHIIENGVEMYNQDITDYTAGKKNTIKLDEVYLLNPNAELIVSVEAIGLNDMGEAFSLDTDMPFIDKGDLYSTDGVNYLSVVGETSSYGNWMMGIALTNMTKRIQTNELIRYDVYMDDVKITTTPTTENAYSIKGNSLGVNHIIKVSALYDSCGEKISEGVQIEDGDQLSIDELESIINVYPNPVGVATNYKLQIVSAEVIACELFDILGKKASIHDLQITSDGATVSLKGLRVGMYMLNIKTTSGNVLKRVAIGE